MSMLVLFLISFLVTVSFVGQMSSTITPSSSL